MKTEEKNYLNKDRNFIEIIILQWKLYGKHMDMLYGSNNPLIFIQRLMYFFSLYLISPKRARIFLSCVMWLRHIDNVSDGDYKFVGSLGGYLSAKEKLIEEEPKELGNFKISNNEDALIIDAIKQASAKNIPIQRTLKRLLLVNKREYMRRRHSILDESQILIDDAIMSDESILIGAIPVMFPNGNNILYKSWAEESPLIKKGIIQRIDWLYDLIDDIRKGVIHIPYEVCEQARMNKEDVLQKIINWECFFRNPVLRSWFNHELLALEAGWKKYLEEQPMWNCFYGPVGGRIVSFVIQRQFGPQIKWLRQMCDEYNKERSRIDYQAVASC